MRWKICAALAATVAIAWSAHAADLRQLVQETQHISGDSGQITMVWWMPQAFWDQNLTASGVSPEEKAQVLKVLQDYTLFALLRAKVGASGLTNVSSKEDLLRNARFEIDGQTVAPFTSASLPPVAAKLLGELEPGLARSMGQVGESMQIVAYPSMKDGRPLLDPKGHGLLQYTLYGKTYFWRLPLATLLPPKVDRATHEEFPGNFEFNPYTGARLSSGR